MAQPSNITNGIQTIIRLCVPFLPELTQSTIAHICMAVSMTGPGHAGSSGINIILHVRIDSDIARHSPLSLVWAVTLAMTSLSDSCSVYIYMHAQSKRLQVCPQPLGCLPVMHTAVESSTAFAAARNAPEGVHAACSVIDAALMSYTEASPGL